MRFAWIPPQYDDDNQIALFDPASYDPANAVTIDPNTRRHHSGRRWQSAEWHEIREQRHLAEGRMG